MVKLYKRLSLTAIHHQEWFPPHPTSMKLLVIFFHSDTHHFGWFFFFSRLPDFFPSCAAFKGRNLILGLERRVANAFQSQIAQWHFSSHADEVCLISEAVDSRTQGVLSWHRIQSIGSRKFLTRSPAIPYILQQQFCLSIISIGFCVLIFVNTSFPNCILYLFLMFFEHFLNISSRGKQWSRVVNPRLLQSVTLM